jgi:hypothetical protein
MNLQIIKRKDLRRFSRIFGDKTVMNVKGAKYSKFVTSNLGKILEQLREVDKVDNEQLKIRGILSEEYLAREKAIIDKYAIKDESGKVKETDGMISISPEQTEAFNKEKNDLLTTDVIKEDAIKQDKYVKYMDSFMEGDIKINFSSLKENDITDDITPNVRMILRDFII